MAVADATKAPTNGEATLDEVSDWPFKVEVVQLDELSVDASYQRGLTSFWKTITEKFNPLLVGTLVVSDRARRKNVVDGQTRLTAMRERGVKAWPCLVYEGLSKKQEAILFSLLQTERRNMTSYERFRAQLVGGDPQAVGIAKIVQEVGFDLDVEETPRTVRAIAALERMWKIDGDHLRQVLELVRDIWGTDNRDAVSAQILGGMSLFIRQQERLDYDRLAARLADVTPKLVINKAAQIREGAGWGTGASKSVAQAILTEYMRRR